MKIFPLTIAGLLLSTAAYAQPAPPPPAAPASRGVEAPPPPLDAEAPPPPPPGRRGPRGDRPPPPPPGAFVHIDRGTDGSLKLDVHCAERDSTKECADITTQLLEKLNSPVKPK